VSDKLFNKTFLAPRYWSGWLGVGALRLIVALPHGLRMSIGRQLGRLTHRLAKKRRQVAEVNVGLCFPKLDAKQQADIVDQHFQSLGMALVETGIAWWASKEELASLHDVDGMHYITEQLEQGRGVILLSAHFTSLELGNRLMSDALPNKLDAMYQAHKHPFKEHIISHYRDIHMGRMVPESDIRQLVRVIRNGGVVWYASDQGYNDKHHIMAPFFGIDCTCNTALSRLAKVSRAAVVPFFIQRSGDGKRFTLRLQPALEDFPSGDEKHDVETYHALIEEHASRVPEQYLWSHRRFKKRGPDYPDVYK
jgi:KDO2-lipid IV(A) lauroyltransferase